MSALLMFHALHSAAYRCNAKSQGFAHSSTVQHGDGSTRCAHADYSDCDQQPRTLMQRNLNGHKLTMASGAPAPGRGASAALPTARTACRPARAPAVKLLGNSVCHHATDVLHGLSRASACKYDPCAMAARRTITSRHACNASCALTW